MLPFLRRNDRSIAGTIITQRRKPDENVDRPAEDSVDSIESPVNDLIDAVHASDSKRAAEALRTIFSLLQMSPSDEPEQENSEGNQ